MNVWPASCCVWLFHGRSNWNSWTSQLKLTASILWTAPIIGKTPLCYCARFPFLADRSRSRDDRSGGERQGGGDTPVLHVKKVDSLVAHRSTCVSCHVPARKEVGLRRQRKFLIDICFWVLIIIKMTLRQRGLFFCQRHWGNMHWYIAGAWA